MLKFFRWLIICSISGHPYLVSVYLYEELMTENTYLNVSTKKFKEYFQNLPDNIKLIFMPTAQA